MNQYREKFLVEGFLLIPSTSTNTNAHAAPTSPATTTTPSTSTATTTASTTSSRLAPWLGNVALDISPADVSPIHGLDGGLCLVSSGEGDERKSLTRVVSISHSSVTFEGSSKILLGSFLTHVVNKQLGSFNIRSPSPTTCSPSTTTSTSAAPAVSSLLSLRPGNVHLNSSAGNVSVVHGGNARLSLFVGTELQEGKTTAGVEEISDLSEFLNSSLETFISGLLADVVDKDLSTLRLVEGLVVSTFLRSLHLVFVVLDFQLGLRFRLRLGFLDRNFFLFLLVAAVIAVIATLRGLGSGCWFRCRLLFLLITVAIFVIIV